MKDTSQVMFESAPFAILFASKLYIVDGNSVHDHFSYPRHERKPTIATTCDTAWCSQYTHQLPSIFTEILVFL
jgi:hypothetical protein